MRQECRAGSAVAAGVAAAHNPALVLGCGGRTQRRHSLQRLPARALTARDAVHEEALLQRIDGVHEGGAQHIERDLGPGWKRGAQEAASQSRAATPPNALRRARHDPRIVQQPRLPGAAGGQEHHGAESTDPAEPEQDHCLHAAEATRHALAHAGEQRDDERRHTVDELHPNRRVAELQPEKEGPELDRHAGTEADHDVIEHKQDGHRARAEAQAAPPRHPWRLVAPRPSRRRGWRVAQHRQVASWPSRGAGAGRVAAAGAAHAVCAAAAHAALRAGAAADAMAHQHRHGGYQRGLVAVRRLQVRCHACSGPVPRAAALLPACAGGRFFWRRGLEAQQDCHQRQLQIESHQQDARDAVEVPLIAPGQEQRCRQRRATARGEPRGGGHGGEVRAALSVRGAVRVQRLSTRAGLGACPPGRLEHASPAGGVGCREGCRARSGP